MSTLEELSTLEATLSPNLSAGLFQDIFNQSAWRLYHSSHHREAVALAKRFLGAHSQIHGGISDRLTGVVPIDVLRFRAQGALYEGFLFLNGAVVKISNDRNYTILLFIDEETSMLWGYPPNFLGYEDRLKQTRRNETAE